MSCVTPGLQGIEKVERTSVKVDPTTGDPSFWYWPQSTTVESSSLSEEQASRLQPSSPPSPSSSNSSSGGSHHHIDLTLNSRNSDNSSTVLSKLTSVVSSSAAVVVLKGHNNSPSDGSITPTSSVNVAENSLLHHHSGQEIHHSDSISGEHSISRTGVDLPTLAELSGELAMSLSPKHPHSTPFSVSDILSPLEESYRIKGLDGSTLAHLTSPPSPYNRISSQTSSGQHSQTSSVMNVPSTSPYTHMHVPQLSHPGAAGFPAQYCNGADLHGMTGHYGDVRGSATGWYGATATDPRFA
ncbi:unnamed protein product, partial [Allacma fusca]